MLGLRAGLSLQPLSDWCPGVQKRRFPGSGLCSLELDPKFTCFVVVVPSDNTWMFEAHGFRITGL